MVILNTGISDSEQRNLVDLQSNVSCGSLGNNLRKFISQKINQEEEWFGNVNYSNRTNLKVLNHKQYTTC